MLFLIYLLKVSACLAVFYGLYFFAFRKFTFHTLNRFYLLCTLLLSFVIPLLSFETTKIVKVEPVLVAKNPPVASISEYSPDYKSIYDSRTIASVQPAAETPDWRFYVIFTYIAVATIMLLFLSAKLFKIYQLSRQAVKADHLRIVQRDGKLTNASFFNLIFLNTNGLTDNEKAQIIAHECVHIRHLHSIDVLLLEVCKIILWFNPIIYFYKKSLIEVHEFEVDLHIIQQFDSKNYAHLLLKLGINHTVDLTNQFSLHPLSTRIQFLFKKRTISIKRTFYMLGLPLLALGIFAFAQRNEKLIYETTKRASAQISSKIESFSDALKSIEKDSVGNKEVTPLASINQKDSTAATFGAMIDPFLFKTPEVALPYPNKITASNNLNRVIISMASTPVEFSFDYYKGGRYVVENTTEGNIKILQDGEELIKDKDYTFVYEDGYISKIKFKEHAWKKNLSISIIAKDLSFRALPKAEAIPLPSIYYRRGDTNQNSQRRYDNLGVFPNKVYFNTDTLRTVIEANFLGKAPLVIINGREQHPRVLQNLNFRGGTSYIAKPNDQNAIDKYGIKAQDGVVDITTSSSFEFGSEKERQIALENVRRELTAYELYKNEKIVKVRLLDDEGKEFERRIIRGFIDDRAKTIDLPLDGVMVYKINGKKVSELDVINYKEPFIGAGYSVNDSYAQIDLRTK